jgi:hypothetical protein
MRRCSNDLVAFIFQGIHTSVILSKVLISTHFCTTLQFPYRYFCRNAVRLHLTLEFQNLTTAHHCTRIMHLKISSTAIVKIGSVLQYFQEFLFAVVSQDIFKEIKVI